MNATELYQTGRLQDAIAAQIDVVKSHPSDQDSRLFLFELLVFAGALDRARRQIEIIKYEDPALDMAVSSYRKLLDAEQARRNLFSQGLAPGFFGEPAEHLRFGSRRSIVCGRIGRRRPPRPSPAPTRPCRPSPAASMASPSSLSATPTTCSRASSKSWPTAVTSGSHWSRSSLTMKAPRFPRDLLFLPAHLELEEEEGEVFLPTLYPASYEHPDDRVKLGRLTDWKELAAGLVLGVGQHTYLRDDDEIGLLEWREFRSGSA